MIFPAASKNFTFQYGSTLICNLHLRLPIHNSLHSNMVLLYLIASPLSRGTIILLYIPIWFYFNDSSCNNRNRDSPLYIPIWFYFNVMQKLIDTLKSFFTFQYGSTLMIVPRNLLVHIVTLHSNMVLL